ncbi:hypothetical protein GQV73_004770, partial [Salmonella enterica subsp. enterica serovar Schwarzengrund]|nr:hypothetical protein [Salmonella enterica subsp. enterica serovar Schwarzengrund]
VRLNSVIITFSGFKSGTCQRYSGRVSYKKRAPKGSFVIVNLLVRRLMHADRAA